jgi:hypothetical protein
MGNASFGFNVTGGLGGSTAFIGLSLAPGSFMAGTTTILVDLSPASLLSVWPVPLGGALGLPGAGSGTFLLPLILPVTPALAGADLYAQAVVNDFPAPGSPAATRGLKVELAMPPRVFVLSGSLAYLIDPLSLTVSYQIPLGSGQFGSVKFANGGRNLLFSTPSGKSVKDVDTAASPPTRSILYAPGASCRGLALDDDRQVAYTLTDPLGVGSELVAVSYAPATYGTVIGQTTGLHTLNISAIKDLALSADGRRAAVLDVFKLVLVDTDRASPGYMSFGPALQLPAPASSPLTLAQAVAFTSDGSQVLVTLAIIGSIGQVARYDLVGGTWIDHDPSTPQVDNIGPSSAPPVPIPTGPSGLAVSRFSNYAVISGPGLNAAGRLDLDPNNPAFFAWTQYVPGVPYAPGPSTCDISGDDTILAIGTPAAPAAQVLFVDAWLGTVVGAVPFPNLTAIDFVRYH